MRNREQAHVSAGVHILTLVRIAFVHDGRVYATSPMEAESSACQPEGIAYVSIDLRTRAFVENAPEGYLEHQLLAGRCVRVLTWCTPVAQDLGLESFSAYHQRAGLG